MQLKKIPVFTTVSNRNYYQLNVIIGLWYASLTFKVDENTQFQAVNELMKLKAGQGIMYIPSVWEIKGHLVNIEDKH